MGVSFRRRPRLHRRTRKMMGWRMPMTGVVAGIVGCLLWGAVVAAQNRNAPITLEEAIQILRATLTARVAPLVFEVPQEQIRWDMTLTRYNQDTFFITYRPEQRPEFRMQLTLCERVGKGKWSDATLLGATESADVFYRDNLSYASFISDLEYTQCLEPLMSFQSRLASNGRALYTSEDRMLKHMANWVTALAAARDVARAGDFLRVLVAKQREVLIAADKERDFERVAERLELFDRMFSFAVLDQNDVVTASDRRGLADWLTTTIAERRKLVTLQPGVGKNLARDEALLKRLAPAGLK